MTIPSEIAKLRLSSEIITDINEHTYLQIGLMYNETVIDMIKVDVKNWVAHANPTPIVRRKAPLFPRSIKLIDLNDPVACEAFTKKAIETFTSTGDSNE